MKIKMLTKFGILLFGISLFFLSSCEQENIEIVSSQTIEQNASLDFNLENLTFNQANNESIFLELKTKFKIEEPIYNPKKKKYFSKVNNTYSKSSSPNDFSDLDPSIDVSVVRKITTPNYVSYTMRVNEPQNATNSFSNIVIQENNGVQEVFTFRYTPTENISSSNKIFQGTYTMSRGMCLPDQNGGDCNGNPDDGGGGGTDDFVEICNDVTVLVPVGCGCGHMPWQSCQGCNGNYPSYRTETQQECYWDYQGSTGTTGNTGTGNTGNPSNGGGSPSGSDGNVITTPVTEILPEGALESLDCLQPNQQQTEWINSQLASGKQLNLASIWHYTTTNGCNETTKKHFEEFVIIASEIEDARFDRYKELIEILEVNPWALIQNCAQQNGLNIANYQLLYDHTLPTECTDRLDALGNDFQDQPLAEGNAAVANVDYYGVEITTYPDFNGDGNPDTEEQIFEKYREDFADLASGGKDDFVFSCNVPFNSTNTGDISWEFSPYFPSDTTLWASSNPITTIFQIEADSNIPGIYTWLEDLSEDDGAIMISAYTSNY